MKRCWPVVLLFLLSFPARAQTPAKTPPPSASALEKRVEAYLRNLYAWGPKFQVKLGPISDSEIAAFYRVPVEVRIGEQTDQGLVYVSKDGRFLFRGEVNDLNADPFAENRAHLRTQGNPSKGPTNAPVTVVEFSDYQCPHCRQLYETLKSVEPRYPQVRFVHMDFPLTQLHAWAMSAAVAGQCAYQHSPEAFWKIHDAIFEHQDTITAENAWDAFLDYGQQAGLNGDEFRACMASSEAKKAVEANMAEGASLNITSTPTVFVNGRAIPGGAEQLLVQYIDYELAGTTPQRILAKPK